MIPSDRPPRVLVARVEALLRRRRRPSTPEREGVIRVGDLAVDPLRHLVSVGSEPVELTSLEFAILEALGRDLGIVLTRQQLLDAVWGGDFVGGDHVVEVHVANLRRKLGDVSANPRYVETVRGVGYRLRAGDQ